MGEVRETTVTYVELQLVEKRKEPAPSDETLVDFLYRAGMNRQAQECFWVISYDPNKYVRTIYEAARGSYWSVSVHAPAVLTAVLRSGSDRFILAHNHPSGPLRATSDDINLTRDLMEMANTCSLYFEDHLIIGPGRAKPFSFVKAGLLVPAVYGERAAASMVLK